MKKGEFGQWWLTAKRRRIHEWRRRIAMWQVGHVSAFLFFLFLKYFVQLLNQFNEFFRILLTARCFWKFFPVRWHIFTHKYTSSDEFLLVVRRAVLIYVALRLPSQKYRNLQQLLRYPELLHSQFWVISSLGACGHQTVKKSPQIAAIAIIDSCRHEQKLMNKIWNIRLS